MNLSVFRSLFKHACNNQYHSFSSAPILLSIPKEAVFSMCRLLTVEKVLIRRQADPVALRAESKHRNEQFLILKAWPIELLVNEFLGEKRMLFQEIVNGLLYLLFVFAILGHLTDYD